MLKTFKIIIYLISFLFGSIVSANICLPPEILAQLVKSKNVRGTLKSQIKSRKTAIELVEKRVEKLYEKIDDVKDTLSNSLSESNSVWYKYKKTLDNDTLDNDTVYHDSHDGDTSANKIAEYIEGRYDSWKDNDDNCKTDGLDSECRSMAVIKGSVTRVKSRRSRRRKWF